MSAYWALLTAAIVLWRQHVIAAGDSEGARNFLSQALSRAPELRREIRADEALNAIVVAQDEQKKQGTAD